MKARRDFKAIQKRKHLGAAAYVEARQSPEVDEEAQSLRRRYRRFRAAQNIYDGLRLFWLDSRCARGYTDSR
jgi:hypothetical protein